jgi:RNA polymerase sigma factor (sigma-70 family)
MVDDVTLLQCFARDSSQEAFEELVCRHIKLVYAVALRSVGNDAHLAKDVTQTVFSSLAQKASSLTIRSNLAGWLYSRTRSSAVDMIRSERRRRTREEQASAINEITGCSPTSSDLDLLRPILEDTIDRLKPGDRETILLRFFEGRPFSEIGSHLGISEDAAQKRADRSLDKIRTVLARRGMNSTAAVLAAALANQTVAKVPEGLSTTITGSAVASAVPGGGTALTSTIITYMTTSKLGLGIASLVSIVAFGTAVFEGQAARQAQTSLAAAVKTHQADLEKQQELARTVASDDEKWAALQKTVDEMRSDAAARGSQAATPSPKVDPQAVKAAELAAGQAFLAAFPQARELLVHVGKAQIARNYAGFFRTANLTPTQIDNLENRTNDLWMQTLTVGPAGVHPGTPTLPDDQLQEILGTQAFQQLQDYRRVQQLQGILNDASSLSTSAPITGEQGDQLLMILAKASSSYQTGGIAAPKTIDWNQVVSQSQGILTTPQLAAVKVEAELAQLGPLLNEFRKTAPATK